MAESCDAQAVVLDDELDADVVADIRLYIERLLEGGLRARLIALIKVRMLGTLEKTQVAGVERIYDYILDLSCMEGAKG